MLNIPTSRKLILGHLIFWVGYIGLVTAVSASFVSWERSLKWILPSMALQVILAYTNIGLLIPQLLKKKHYLNYVLAVIALILLLVWLRIELYDLLPHTTRRERPSPPFWTRFFGPTFWSLIQIWAMSTAYSFLKEWFREQQLRADLKSKQLETELKFLKNQISPHFLFNSLNNLYSLIHTKDERAGPVVLKLSELLRYMLKESPRTEVPLEMEIEFMRNYIELQLLKTEEPRDVRFSVEGVRPEHQIAPLLLLNFFENAFKHSDWEKNPQARIHASLSMSGGNTLHFALKNTVRPGKNTEPIEESIGLKNVRRRLTLLYPGRHELGILSEKNEFSVTLSIKLD